MKQVILALSLVFLGAAVIVTQHIEKKVTRFELPQGELKWSNVKPKNENEIFIIESNYPMTMPEIAQNCSKYCSDAIYF